eukprot:m.865403 g.865403  ORF g.865403 m.865403 type:complete len:163 (+) comp23550_c0_seq5:528-1016(+)
MKFRKMQQLCFYTRPYPRDQIRQRTACRWRQQLISRMGLGITLVSAFLFCELHLIAILIVTFRRILHAAQSLPPIRRYVRRTGLLTVLGFGCWLVDRIGCSSLLHFCTVWGLPNPQLHAWWHFWTALALNEAFFVCECAYMLPLGTAPMYFPILAREWGKSD